MAKREERSLAIAFLSLPPRAATNAEAPTTSTVAASKDASDASSSAAACSPKFATTLPPDTVAAHGAIASWLGVGLG